VASESFREGSFRLPVIENSHSLKEGGGTFFYAIKNNISLAQEVYLGIRVARIGHFPNLGRLFEVISRKFAASASM
jgi:hypothetical protein